MSENNKLSRGSGLIEQIQVIGKVVTINSQSIRVYERDESGNVLRCSGTVSITAAGSGYAKGCLYIKTDAGAGTEGVYRNVGTSSSCTFEAIDTIAASEIALTDGDFLVGNGSNVAAGVTMSGDATIDNTGALTIGAGAVTNSKVADSDGTGGLEVAKSAVVVYDFAVDGGTAGTIALTGSPTLPDNAVVWVEAIEVVTTFTSSTDAATFTLNAPTDGAFFTAIAISDASNPWDAGIFVSGDGALVAGSRTPKKLTAARTLEATVAGGENITAGKAIFHLRYYVSE